MHICTWSLLTPLIAPPVHWNSLYSLISLSLRFLFLITLYSDPNFKSPLWTLAISSPSKALKSTNLPLQKQTLFLLLFLFPEASFLQCTNNKNFDFPSQPKCKSSSGDKNVSLHSPRDISIFLRDLCGFPLLVPRVLILMQLLHRHRKLTQQGSFSLGLMFWFRSARTRKFSSSSDVMIMMHNSTKDEKNSLKNFSSEKPHADLSSAILAIGKNFHILYRLLHYQTPPHPHRQNSAFPKDSSSSDKNASPPNKILTRQHTNESKPPFQTQPRTGGIECTNAHTTENLSLDDKTCRHS